jgi:DNA-binding NtrC family response regulator
MLRHDLCFVWDKVLSWNWGGQDGLLGRLRLDVLTLAVPPLRKRISDLSQLIDFKLTQLNKSYGLNRMHLRTKDMKALLEYPFPGNVRELFNLIERAYFSGNDGPLVIDVRHIQSTMTAPIDNSKQIISLKENERKHILKALEYCGGKISGKSGAAELLRVNRSTLNSKMKVLGI